MDLTEIFLFSLVTLIFYYIFTDSEKVKFLKRFPGPRILPIIGQLYVGIPKPEDFLRTSLEFHRKYGHRMALTAGPLHVLQLTHPDDVKKILSRRDVTTNKPWIYGIFFKNWLGSCLFNQLGKEYFRRRKIIMPAYDFGMVENSAPVFNHTAQVLVEILKRKEKKEEVVEIHSLLALTALDVICESSMGTSVSCLTKNDQEFAEASHKQQNFLFDRIAAPWLWFDIFYNFSPLGKRESVNRKITHDFVDHIVQKRKSNILAQNISHPQNENQGNENEDKLKQKRKLAFLDLLIEKQLEGLEGFTDKDIRDETNFFIFAGHDTTAATMAWTIYLLATHPEEQFKVQEEVDEFFNNDPSRQIEASELVHFKHLECCVKESMRLYPPVAFFGRTVEQDFELDEKTTIPKGMNVLIVPWLTHRNPEIFPDPEKFKPSRFSTENSKGRHPYSYIPFSAGPRNCVGQKFAMAEAKTILAHVFKNFLIEMESPKEKIIPLANGVMTPLKGINIKLKLR